MTEKNKCVRCNTREGTGGWIYIWKGKSGYCCETCSIIISHLGSYLLDKAVFAMQEQGIHIQDFKEKFGTWRIYAFYKTKRQQKFRDELLDLYNKMFPEFTWDWD